MTSEIATRRASIKVGLLVLGALGLLMAGILLIGEQNNLFRPMNRYSVRFADVDGLQAGNPVQLNGVAVGRVTSIVLPESPDETHLTVWIDVDRRFGQRVRKDSHARIQTLGLLGDKYIELTSGTGNAVLVPSGGEIATAPATDVDRLINSGEDAVQNIVAISSSLARILDRIERGDSILGELMAPLPEESGRVSMPERIHGTLDRVDRLLDGVENGGGPLGRLLFDEQAGDRLVASIGRFESLLQSVQEGDGLLPALLYDDELEQEARGLLAELRGAGVDVRELIASIENAEGLLPRLIEDKGFADRTTERVEKVLERLDDLSLDLTEGEGTVPRLIRDPEVYEALNDVIVGVHESRLLRWLIRNRQKAGIEKRYRETRSEAEIEEEVKGESPDPDAEAGGGNDGRASLDHPSLP